MDLTLFKDILQEEGRLAPRRGTKVQVRTKKHFGKIGVVFWHGVDKFSHAGRYGDPIMEHLRQCGGRYGYRVGVQLESGEKIFTSAEQVIVEVM